MNSSCKIVVLISGNGSNLQAIIDSVNAKMYLATVAAVISNKAGVYGLERAKQAGIATHVIEHQHYSDRQTFDRSLAEIIDSYQPDLIVLAGFMRILTAEFVNHYLGRLLNIHPSLLPKYPGLNTHQKALESGDAEHGCSVHFVTPELDGGPIIIQAATPIHADIELATLIEKVHQLEHKIYPLAVQWFAEQRLALLNDEAFLDGKPLPKNGYRYVQ